MKKLLPLFILIFAFSALGQLEEPIAGKLDEIKGFTKVCIVGESKKVRGAMIDALKQRKAKLEVVEAENAQFFLEYSVFRKKENTTDREEVELSAYYYNSEKQKVVVWIFRGFFLIGVEGISLPANALTKTFVSDLTGNKSGKE